ncbi:MAG TPA: RNA methyltransferase [Acidimicrobiales bacterium]|nr:RNA methyltransferase [Acidimicrobiales bacterium]
MARIIRVDDPADQRVGDYVGLSDPDLRRRREGSAGADGAFFIAEGTAVIRRLLGSPYRVRSLLLTPRRLALLEPDLAGVEAPVYVGSQEVVNAVSGFHLHRGALASAHRDPLPDPLALAAAADLVVVGEGLNDHENLGALFRNAAAFGAGALLLDPTSADPLYRRSVRVSVGQVLRVPFARAAPWPGVLHGLRDLGFELLALTPAEDAVDLRAVAPRPRQAVLVGAEWSGLSPAAQAAAHRRVRIPMAAGVDSLNVATAAAVALHHLARVPST